MAEKNKETSNYTHYALIISMAVLFADIIMASIASQLTDLAIYASTFFIVFMLWAGFNALIKAIEATK